MVIYPFYLCASFASYRKISSFKQKLVEHTKDSPQLRNDLRKALNITSALAAHTTVTTTIQPNLAVSEDDSNMNNTAALDTYQTS